MLQRAITRSSCLSLRSSRLFTTFQSSKVTQEHPGGREGDLLTGTRACPLHWVSNTNSLAKLSLVKLLCYVA